MQIESIGRHWRKIVVGLYAIIAVALLASPAISQAKSSYPNGPVKLVVPYAAGGMLDSLARVFSRAVSTDLGQPVVVEDHPGAAGRVGASFVSQSAPDGQTILFTLIGTMTILPLIPPKPTYDPDRDFIPLAALTQQQLLIAVRSSLGVTSFAQLVDLAKKEPGKLTYGSPGVGSESHLTTARLLKMTGLNLLHVPYRGGAPEMVDFLAGRLDLVVLPEITLRPAIAAKKAIILGTLASHRLEAFPDVPSIKELGYPGAAYTVTIALFVPAKTPSAVIEKWNKVLPVLKRDQNFLKALKNTGSSLAIEEGSKLKQAMSTDHKEWSRVIRSLNLKSK